MHSELHVTEQVLSQESIDTSDDPFAFLDDLIDEQDNESDQVLDQEMSIDLDVLQEYIRPEDIKIESNIVQFEQNINAKGENFIRAFDTAGSAVNSLVSLLGSCGPVCAHALGGLGQVGASATSSLGSSGSVFSGMDAAGFSVDGQGNFSLTGSVDDLSKRTGISRGDLLSGRYSALDILSLLISSVFGECSLNFFGFGLFGGLIDMLIPGPQSAAVS